jgi:AcrR family transcriptional regulator
MTAPRHSGDRQMKAVRLEDCGGGEVIEVCDVPRPEPGPDQVLVAVRAAAITGRTLMRITEQTTGVENVLYKRLLIYQATDLISSMESTRTDQRREAGLRTRTRLMDAALDLLAERGEDGISLREVTGAAQANVASVSYHFGSLQSLCDEAIEYALERYLAAQEEAIRTLGADASLEDLAGAFAGPMMRALAKGGRDLDVMRIVARSGIDPPAGWDRFDASFDRIRAGVLGVLKANVPDVKDQELIFRTRCAAGLLNWLVLAPVGDELRNRSERQIERLLVPLLAGAFRGISSV